MNNKSLLSTFLTAMMIIGLILVSTDRFNTAQASDVSGTISTNTTWTKANSPYSLTAPVTVSNGVTLTIEAGVTVNLNGYKIQVNGILDAQGSSADKIIFTSDPAGNQGIAFTSTSTSWNEGTGAGCIIENAVLDSVSISITSASPKISNNSITASPNAEDGSAILIDSGSPTITKNTVIGDIENLNSASPTISNNSITGGIYGTAILTSSPIITNNNIKMGSIRGSGIRCDGINVYVADNIVSDCPTGINAFDGTSIIERNLVFNNVYGVRIGGMGTISPTIRNNTITNNDVGIYANNASYWSMGSLTIINNNIQENSNYSLCLANGVTNDIDATFNWWGTTDAQAINQSIFDFKNDSTLGNVTFVPFLAVPNPKAQPATGPTYISGIIGVNTTWTAAKSPYSLIGPVLVSNGVSLTIEAGATVNLNSYYITVNGTLVASGNDANPIYINGGSSDGITFLTFSSDWNEQTSTGCIIENAVLNSTSVNIYEASPKITSSIFEGIGISIDAPLEGLPIISNNTIRGTGGSGAVGIYCSSNATILDNTVSGFGQTGIYLFFGSPTVKGNLIYNNGGEGIRVDRRIDYGGYPNPIIENNTIFDNSVGIIIYGNPQPKIIYNNIENNTDYSVYLNAEGVYPTGGSINATYNWWGTTDTQAINQTIRDKKNDFNLGEVDFVPFLSDMNPGAPTIPTFTITASAGTGGSISPSGSVTVAYGGDQTFTVTPDSGYQIASVTMDGVPATAPYTFVNVASDHTISASFEEVPTPTPTPTPSPSPSPSPTPTPTPTSTQISISVNAPSTAVGSAVNINGRLSDSNGNSLNDQSVTLSYALTGSDSWVPVGSGTTNSAGEYSIQWVNTASGTFTLKVEWNGNDEYLGASATTTLSFLPYQNQQVFFVESNSTVTALAFNSTSLELSFTVNGTSETAGYVKVTIAKTLVANAENIKVYLDGNQLNYDVTSNPDSWLLTFTYTHSTHNVMISLAANEPEDTVPNNDLILIAITVVIAVVAVASFMVWRKKKKT